MSKPTAPIFFAATLAFAGLAFAHADEKDLPAGPIRDRHELMERIGKNAKTIGESLKSGKHDPIEAAAKGIEADSAKALALFPQGSTDPKSRAKDEIWADWAKFEKINKNMGAKAGELAAAAAAKGDVGAAADAMYVTCKSCHDAFRKPEEKKH